MQPLNIHTLPLDGKTLIEASAGTGKTFTIGLIVLRLLLEKPKNSDKFISIEKIALVTFSKAATAELRKKTSEKIIEAYSIWKNGSDKDDDLSAIIKNAKKENAQVKEANLLDAIARIDEMPVFTIHGFCEKLLSEFAYETKNFEKKELITERSDIENRIVADFWRREVQNLDEALEINPDELLNSINSVANHSQAKINGEDYERALAEYKAADEKKKEDAETKLKYAIACKLAIEVNEKLQEEKKKLKVMDYNDMIENCYRAVKNDRENILQKVTGKRYEAILADEFQDTDKMQYEIFDYLFKGKPFFMIGDPKQAIYGFRGGDIYTYNQAKSSIEENNFKMNKNYRSEKILLDAMNDFFNSESFAGKMGYKIDYDPVECGSTEEPVEKKDNKYNPFVIWKGQGTSESFKYKVKQAVIAEIKRLLGTGKFEPKNIAILLDKNNDCLNYKNALAKERIFAVVKGDNVFSGDAAGFLRTLLNAICHNNDVKYIRTLLVNNLCGFEPKDLDDILMEWTNAIYETKLKWEKFGIMNAVDFFMTKQNLWSHIAANINGERNITNIRQLLELLSKEEMKFGKIPEKINYRFAVLCSNAEKNEEAEEKLETDEDSLKIMTIHKSKGLQFDIIFVPDVTRHPHEHKFPNAYVYHSDNEKAVSYLAEDEHAKAESDREAEEETARFLYVALTRAKQRLYVAYLPPKRKKNNEISKAKGSTSCCREIFDDFCNSNASGKIQIADLDEVFEEKYEYSNSEPKNIAKQHKLLPEDFEIKPAWQRTSFTGISQNLEHKDYFHVAQQMEIKIPAGKRIGTILHSIFENLDFNAGESEIQNIIESKLGGFKEFSNETEDGKKRKQWIEKQVKNILSKNLSGAGKLCEVDSGSKIAELNFFMKSEKIDLKKIKSVMKDKIYDFEVDELPDKYIKGAIDLVFLGKDGKYYILDWKSNSLGDFSQKGMDEAMLHHGYHLQYYIYAVALKRWLEQTHENFDFKKQFGGAYYIFIRGVNEKEDNFDGIYFADGKGIAEFADII